MPTEAEFPKVQSYAALLYERMRSEAFEQQGQLIWTGRLIETTAELGIPRGTYKRVTDALKELGCIEMIGRGYRGKSLSVFVLNAPPTPDRWDRFVKSARGNLTGTPSLDTLAGQLRDIQRQLGGLDIVAALKNHEDRLTALEDLASSNRNTNNDKTE